MNGQILADAYFMPEEKLVDLKETLSSTGSLRDSFYFRSSLTERTQMSGAQLLSSLIR